MHDEELLFADKEVTLLEVLDRALDKGIVLAADLTISVADVDLIYVGLRALISSVETMEKLREKADYFEDE